MRRSQPALTRGELAWVDNDAPSAVLSYLRTSAEEKVLTVVNLTNKPVNVKLAELKETFKPLLAEGVKHDERGSFALESNGYFVGRK